MSNIFVENLECYLCSPLPPTKPIKPKDRYYCEYCTPLMEEATIIREGFVKTRKNQDNVQHQPKSKQIHIAGKKKRDKQA